MTTKRCSLILSLSSTHFLSDFLFLHDWIIFPLTKQIKPPKFKNPAHIFIMREVRPNLPARLSTELFQAQVIMIIIFFFTTVKLIS